MGSAIREAEVAINHILGIDDRMDYDCVPGVVYTNPELAGVGKTEEELIAKGIYYRIQKLPMVYSGRFVAENELGNGLCKLIIDHNDRIVGCHMLGNPASELLSREDIRSMNLERVFSRTRQSVKFITRHCLPDAVYK